MHKQPKRTSITVAVISTLVLMNGGVATAGPLNVTNTFVASQPATAASVNQNFTDVETQVTDNDGRITTNTGNIGTNTTNIGTNTSSTATNATDIGTNTTNIGTNTTDIGTNTTNIGNNFSSITGNTSDISTNTADIADHETRVTALEGAGGGGASLADNSVINVDCSTESLQAAIETAPLHGETLIIISGACGDDILVRRGNIEIRGFTGPGTDSITGNASGFSSDPLDGYNESLGSALVNRSLSAAVEIDNQARVVLSNMTIDSGSNATAVRAVRNTSLKLQSATLLGGVNGFGLHASNSDVTLELTTITGDGTASPVLLAGSAVMAEQNSVVELQDGNTFTGGNGDTAGFFALNNTVIKLNGGSNVFTAGTNGGDPNNEPVALLLVFGSSLIQLAPTASNAINGDLDVEGSQMYLTAMDMNTDIMEIFGASAVTLLPTTLGAITVDTTEIELGAGATFDIGDDGVAVDINSGGVAGTMRLLEHATALIYGGSLINMDIQLHRGSSIDGGDNSKIGGNLDVHGFSVYVMSGQTGTSVAGTVSCFNGEAFEFTAAAPGTPIALGTCN